MSEITVVVPGHDHTPWDIGLRRITAALIDHGYEAAGGVLGGETGYGCEYHNDVFTMRPFWWGECTCGFEARERQWCDDNPHADDCLVERVQVLYETITSRVEREAAFEQLRVELGVDDEPGWRCECTCGIYARYDEEVGDHGPECRMMLANFEHRSGVQIRWYKWIGRDMEIDEPDDVDVAAIIDECIASIVPASPAATS